MRVLAPACPRCRVVCALAEEAEDLRALAEFEARLAAGIEETLPAAFANRLIDGEQPVRVWREYRGLSQAELSRRSGVHRVAIVQIENGRRSASVETLRRLADALGLTVDDLI